MDQLMFTKVFMLNKGPFRARLIKIVFFKYLITNSSFAFKITDVKIIS